MVHDMRETFKANYFDLATNLFTSFGYFKTKADEQNTINAMAKNLKSNGILVIDFMNVKKVVNNLISSEQKIITNVTFNITRKVKNNYIIKDIVILDGLIKKSFKEQVKIITLIDFSNVEKFISLGTFPQMNSFLFLLSF